MNISVTHGYYYNKRLMPFHLDININPDYYANLKRVLAIKRSKDLELIRTGKHNDGGYLMLDAFYGNIAYSFGISNDVSWDENIAQFGYNIYMYDPTIDALPYTNSKFHFFKKGLAGETIQEKQLDTLENFIAQNEHDNKKNMILKIDIEGYEWDFLSSVKSSTLEKFDQILFEFHNVITEKTDDEWKRTISLLEKINKTHALVHLHGNNCDFSIEYNGQCFPNALEATYVNKEQIKVTDAKIKLPDKLDEPNDRGRKDLILGKWNTPFKT